ncbi:MAG: FKBP-type peptidyl-prolyl cis-trans isomerase [Saprospiraceae bacterium]|nr:FKBP-type peptidyl-prolyl cis-trans isomerase [Saprospiraceae bacterium]
MLKNMILTRISIMAMFSSILLFSACGGSKESKFTGFTSSGYPYIMHIDSVSATPEEGDKLRFNLIVRNKANQILAQEDMTGILPNLEASRGVKPEIEILYLMTPGDSASLYVFGEPLKKLPLQNIGPDDTLIYEIGFVDIIYKKEKLEFIQKKETEITTLVQSTLKGFQEGTLGDKLITTKSGLQYVVHTQGTGEVPKPGNIITMEYYGAFMDGKTFDNSFIQGKPMTFNLGQGAILPGLDEGLTYLKEGAIATFIIPYALAYGVAGAPPYIPEKTDLVFYIELSKVTNHKLSLTH